MIRSGAAASGPPTHTPSQPGHPALQTPARAHFAPPPRPGKPAAGRSRQGLLRLLRRAPRVRAAATAEGAGGVSASAAPLAAPLGRVCGGEELARRAAAGHRLAGDLRPRSSLSSRFSGPCSPGAPALLRRPERGRSAACPRLTRSPPPPLPPLRSRPGWSVSGGIRRREAPRPVLLALEDRPARCRGLSGCRQRGGRWWGGLR